ncbi:DUF1801 domain-containing protein [bacterium]|nr:DUF1801 domain-containing protein [bacterium]
MTCSEVIKKYKLYPEPWRSKLLKLRELIFATAEKNQHIDGLIESLKWGEPSYTPRQKNIGTSLRLSWSKKKPHQYGIYVPCQSNLIAQYQLMFGETLNYEGKRGLIFYEKDRLPKKTIEACIHMALNYHLNKKTIRHKF